MVAVAKEARLARLVRKVVGCIVDVEVEVCCDDAR